ncbi:MAG: hypothetical protein K9J42_14885 [Sulfuritalea sp.]|nr:hypothetical protein [Sulfuritalea sp.]
MSANRVLPAKDRPDIDRRRLIRLLTLLPLAVLLPQAARAKTALAPTPRQALGPYYPLHPDAAAGNDLTTNDGGGRAAGTPLTIVGRVLDRSGRAETGVLVEIWQTNAHGRYHHPHDSSPQALDPQFRGYGRATTAADGSYRFRSVQPAAYPGRTPHVHFRLSRAGRELLVTQMYLQGPAGGSNQKDGLFMALPDAATRALLIGVPQADAAENLRFDIVLETAR